MNFSVFVVLTLFVVAKGDIKELASNVEGAVKNSISDVIDYAKNNLNKNGTTIGGVDYSKTLEDYLPAFQNSSDLPSTEEAEEFMKKRCERYGNNETFANFEAASEDFQFCTKSIFNFDNIEEEINKYKKTGDLDKVFKKYCHKVPHLKNCTLNLINAAEGCMSESERIVRPLVMNVTEALNNFICYKEGDRIALFYAEGGPDCLSQREEGIKNCLNSTFIKNMRHYENMTEFRITKQECFHFHTMQQCIVTELEQCSEPTPANIIDSLMNYIRRSTPCSEYDFSNGSSILTGNVGVLLISLTAILFVLQKKNV